MSRIFSNGPQRDYVINPFKRLVGAASRLYLAAPYFSLPDPILRAAAQGKHVHLLVGLNSATIPRALEEVHGVPGIDVRYLTWRFHAKIYIFGDAALLGSSNLTDGGLLSNREAVICFDQPEDTADVDDILALFFELWESSRVLTTEVLRSFTAAREKHRRIGPDPDLAIEGAIGRVEPPNIAVASRKKSTKRIFEEELRRQVHEQYGPAFAEVSGILEREGLRRTDLARLALPFETNRFLNYVRLTHVIGDEAWQSAPHRSNEERRTEITRYGREWAKAEDHLVPEDYFRRLDTVDYVFEDADAFGDRDQNEITSGLMSIHAFTEQFRFVKGGEENLPTEFWNLNGNNLSRVKSTLSHLLYGSGDFIERLHDTLFDSSMKLRRFGRFCALELYGTVNPEKCPPMNGRMAKALRFLGFDVKGA